MEAAFQHIDVGEIVALTVLQNHRSERVMQKLGMTRNVADDFDHPLVTDDAFKRHLLYRLDAESPGQSW